MNSKNQTLQSLDSFIEEQYGKESTPIRHKFEKGFEAFKLGALIQEARVKKGLTQEQLAQRCGTNKGYISKVENNIKDVRISSLLKIVEQGLGGHVLLKIKF